MHACIQILCIDSLFMLMFMLFYVCKTLYWALIFLICCIIILDVLEKDMLLFLTYHWFYPIGGSTCVHQLYQILRSAEQHICIWTLFQFYTLQSNISVYQHVANFIPCRATPLFITTFQNLNSSEQQFCLSHISIANVTLCRATLQ